MVYRMLEQQISDAFPGLNDEEVRSYVERDIAGWMRDKVTKHIFHIPIYK